MKSHDQTEVNYIYNGSIISSGPRNPKHYDDIHVCNVTNHNLTGSGTTHDDYCDSNFVHINSSVITHSYYQMYSAYKTLKGTSYSDTEFKQKIGTLLFGVLQTLPASIGFEGWALSMQQNALPFAIAEKDVDFYYAVKEGLDEVGLLQTIDESALTFYKVTFSYDTSSGESLVSGTTIGYTNNSSEILYSTNNPETSTIITLPIIKKINYKFLGWYTSRSSTGKPVLVMNNSNQLVLTTGSTYVVTENSNTKWKLSSNLTLYPKFEVIKSTVTLSKSTTLGDGVTEFISTIDGFSEIWLEDASGNKLTDTSFNSGTKLYLKYSLNSNTEYNKWLNFSFVKWEGATLNNDANGTYIVVGSDNLTITATAKVELKKFSFQIQDNNKFSTLEAVLSSNSQKLSENTDYPSKYKIELRYEYIENAIYDLESITWEIVSGNATITNQKYIEYAVGVIEIRIVPVEKEKSYTLNLVELDSNGNRVDTSNLNKLYMSSVAGNESSKYGTGLNYNQWDFGETVYFNYEGKVGYSTTVSDFYYINKQTNAIVNISKIGGNYSLTLPSNESDENFKNYFGDVQENKVLDVFVKVTTEEKQHIINISFKFVDNFSGDVNSLTKNVYFKTSTSDTKLPSGSTVKFGDVINIYSSVDSTNQYNFYVYGLTENGVNVGSSKPNYYEYQINYTEQKEENINLVLLVNYEIRKYQITLVYDNNDFDVKPYLVDENGITITNSTKFVLEYNSTKKYYVKYTLKNSDSTLYEVEKVTDKNNTNLSFDTDYYFKVLDDSITQINIITKESTKQYDLDVSLNLEKAENSTTDYSAKAYYSVIGQNSPIEVSDDLKLDYGKEIEVYIEIPKESLEFFYEITEILINGDNSIYSGFDSTELKELADEDFICVKITRNSNYIINTTNSFVITIKQKYQEYSVHVSNDGESYIKQTNVYNKVNNTMTISNSFHYGDTVYLTYELIADDDEFIYLFKSFKLKKLTNSEEITQKEIIEGVEYYKFVLSEDKLSTYKDDQNILEVITETDKQLQQYSISVNFDLVKAEDSDEDFTAKLYYSLTNSNTKIENSNDVKLDYGTEVEIYIEIPKQNLKFFYEVTKVSINGDDSIYTSFEQQETKENFVYIKITTENCYTILANNLFNITVEQYYQEYTISVENEAITYIKENFVYKYDNNFSETDTFRYQEVVYLSYELISDTEQYKYSFVSFNLIKNEDLKEIEETENIQSNIYYKVVLTDEILERFKDESNNIRIISSTKRELQKYSINMTIIKQYEESVEENRQEFDVDAYYTLSSDTNTRLDTDLEYGAKFTMFMTIPLNTLYYKYVIEEIKFNNLNLTTLFDFMLKINKDSLRHNKDVIVVSLEREIGVKNNLTFVIKQYYQTHDVCVYNDATDIKSDNRLKTIPVKMSCEGGVNLLENSDFKNITFDKIGYSYSDYVVVLRDNDYCPENYVNGVYDSKKYCPSITDIDWSVSIYPKWIANRYKITFDTETNGGSLSNKDLQEVYIEFDSNNLFLTNTGDTPIESLPVANKENYQFIGWLFNNVEVVINITNTSCELKENVVIDEEIIIQSGKWKYPFDIVLSAAFGGISKKFNLVDGANQTSLYIEYGTSLDDGVYLDEGRTNEYNYAAPTKINYTFLGWFIDLNEESVQLFTTDKTSLVFSGNIKDYVSDGKWVCENEITAYAKYSPNIIEIELVLNDGEFKNTELNTLYFYMDSSVIYVNKNVSNLEVIDFLSEGILSKTGYNFTGWYLDQSYSDGNKLFSVYNSKLKLEEVLNFTKFDNEDIILSPNMETTKISLFAGFSAIRYKVDFVTNNDTETIKGYQSIYFEFGSNKIYSQENGGEVLTTLDMSSAIKTGYRIISWKVKEVDDVIIKDYEIFISFQYSSFYTVEISNNNINYDLKIDNLNVFDNQNWILASNIVVIPEFEARAVELTLNKQSESWHTGLETSMSYYAKYNDNKIYVKENDQLVELGSDEICSVDEIKEEFKDIAKFVGWGFNCGQTGIYNNLLLINVNNENKEFEKNIYLFGVNYTDENGNFVYISRSSLNLIAIAKRISKQIEFLIGENENFIDYNGNQIENVKGVVLSIYLNSNKDKLFDANGNSAKLPLVTKKGYTFVGWKLQEYNRLIVEHVDGVSDFVPNVYVLTDGGEISYTNGERMWVCVSENTILIPVFKANVYSISFIVKNDITNASVPNLKGLIKDDSNKEYEGNNIKLYFEYGSGLLYDSNDTQSRQVVNTPLAESIGFDFMGWKTKTGNILYNSNGEIFECESIIEDGCFINDGNIELESIFSEIYYQVDFYITFDSLIGTYFITYISDKLFEKMADGSYQEIRLIEIPEEKKVINTVACKYVFDSWVIAHLDENGNLIIVDEEVGLLKHTNKHLSVKTTSNLVVVPKYNEVKNSYKLNFYVNNIENPYNPEKVEDYGFVINILNVNNLESVEYGRPVEFTIDIASSHNKSKDTMKVMSYVNNEYLRNINDVYTYTIGTTNKIIISDVVINKYIVTFKLPDGSVYECQVEHGQDAIKPTVEKGKMEIIWFTSSFKNINKDKVITVKKLNIMIPIGAVGGILVVIIIIVSIKKHKEKVEIKKTREKMSNVIHSQMPNQNPYQQQPQNQNLNNPYINNLNNSYNSSNNMSNSNYQNGNYNQYNNQTQQYNSTNLPNRDFNDIDSSNN